MTSIVLIAIVELLTSVIEAIVNRIATELHELSANIKESSLPAVFLF
ncbi:MAG: diacylglycerol kinase [Arsenophonus sp. NC-WZS1-MAG3]